MSLPAARALSDPRTFVERRQEFAQAATSLSPSSRYGKGAERSRPLHARGIHRGGPQVTPGWPVTQEQIAAAVDPRTGRPRSEIRPHADRGTVAWKSQRPNRRERYLTAEAIAAAAGLTTSAGIGAGVIWTVPARGYSVRGPTPLPATIWFDRGAHPAQDQRIGEDAHGDRQDHQRDGDDDLAEIHVGQAPSRSRSGPGRRAGGSRGCSRPSGSRPRRPARPATGL